MEKTSVKKGRPPATCQAMPLFFGMTRGRVKEEVIMSAATAKELRSYIDWASGLLMMPDDEVMVRIVDHALTEYFKRDTAWRNGRVELPVEGRPAATITPAAAQFKTGGAPSLSPAGEKAEPRPVNGIATATGNPPNKVG
jgi:hypothetical protein